MQEKGMYCSTCGSLVPAGRRRCDTCGASVGYAGEPGAARPVGEPGALPPGRWALARDARNCPRCGYAGEGISYFSRGTHVAALVGATVLTAGAMGAGGLVFYLVRRDHVVCPRCGRGWGKYGERALTPAKEGRPPTPAARGGAPEQARRVWSILMLVLAALAMTVGIVEAEIFVFVVGMLAGGGAYALHQSANRARDQRRAAMIASLQLPVLKLASERVGRLTVTEVAAELGWTLPRAEKVLQSLDDGIRVDSQVTDEGVIVYEFRELLPPGGSGGTRLEAGPDE